MTEPTPRDRAWLAVIDALVANEDIRIADIVEDTGVSRTTAQGVLHVAKDEGLVTRETDQSHWFTPNVGPLGEVEDPSYRRAIQTLIAEAKED